MHRPSPIPVTLSLFTLLATGCGTSAPARYYSLVPVAATSELALPSDVAVSIGPVRVADYLKRSQIVTRGEGVRADLAEFDLWTEPLAKSLQRTIADNVAALLGSDRVFEYPAQSFLENGYQGLAQITRFDTDAAGNAVLEVQWMIQDLDGNMVSPPKRSRYTRRVSAPADYDAIVTTLSELVGDFSRDIAAALAELP